MADNSDEENLNIPTNNQSENRSDEIIPTTDTDTISANQETEKMEVHHHPDVHHKRKKFREYLLEFLMIFLAVTLGFFAENIRENYVEYKSAREYASLLIEDLATDTVELNRAAHIQNLIITAGDSLGNLL